MIKKLLLSALLMSSAFVSMAKDGYKINATISNVNDTLVYLCHYFGNPTTVYKDDSAKLVSGTNNITLKTDKKIVGGIYILLFSDKTMQFEFLLNNGDDFSMEFSKLEPIKTVKFKNSQENDRFYEYQNYMQSIGGKYNEIQTELKSAKTKKDTANVNEKSTALNKEINAYRKTFINKYPTSLASLILRTLEEPEVPKETPLLADGKTKDSTFAYRYYKSHYWDGFNFKDDRIIYTPIYENKLEAYYKLVVPSSDSCIYEANKIMRAVEGQPDLFKYSFWWQTRHFGTSKVMGLDEAYAYMIENYVMQDKCPWLEDSTKKDYIKDYYRISPNTIGKQAPEISIMDVNDKPAKLSETVFDADYTLLAFYDPTCHHCEKEIPSMDSLIKEVMRKTKINIKAVGIQNANEDVKWRKFIVEKKLGNFWKHMYDPKNTSNYRQAYNVVSNPTFYLLDADGNIVGKRIDHTNLEGLFTFLEKKKKEGKKP
jgi:thiol-disulfide isomerase/thioredoxin